jgi:hypothetical protein
MRAAPPVTVHGTGGAGWRATRALLPGLTACVLLFWALQRLALVEAPWDLAAALVAGLAATVPAWRLAAPRTATLAWDGQAWLLDGQPGTLRLMVDAGGWLLLRHGRRWLALAAADAGAQWHALRVAVHAQGPVRAAATRPPLHEVAG